MVEKSQAHVSSPTFREIVTHLLKMHPTSEFTFVVRWSSQAMRMRSAVAGESKRNRPDKPDSILAKEIASLMAKKTLEARNKGGSPTAYDKYIIKL